MTTQEFIKYTNPTVNLLKAVCQDDTDGIAIVLNAQVHMDVETLRSCLADLRSIIDLFDKDLEKISENDIVSECQEKPDDETLKDIAYDETASIRDQGDKDYFDGYDLGDIIRDVAVDSFLKGYHCRKAKEGK